MFVFIRRTCIFGGDLPTRLEIGTEAFELFFPTCLIGTFFSQVILVIGALPAFLLVSLIRHFLVLVMKLLAGGCILYLL